MIFADIAGKTVELHIEDPYLAVRERNRESLCHFLSQLQELNTRFAKLTLVWNGSAHGAKDSIGTQRQDLEMRLQKLGLGKSVVEIKCRPAKRGHFHDRTRPA